MYRINTEGAVALITPGDYDVVNIVRVDEESGYVYFIASPDNPTQRYLYRTRLDGKGSATRLTPSDKPGDHSYQIAPGGKYAFHTYSNVNQPPVIDLISLPDHRQSKGYLRQI